MSTILFIAFQTQIFASNTVHYIGFNTLNSDDKESSGKIFDRYIHKLMPIMEKYEMSLQIFDVVHGGSEKLNADRVTIGSVKNMETFQAFFSDPDLQAILPMLDNALSEHQVVFTESSMEKSPTTKAHTLLSLSWLKGNEKQQEIATKAIDKSKKNIQHIFENYGVNQLATTVGLMSNKGLGQQVQPTHAPQQLELWSMRDAHGFFEHKEVVASTHEIKEYIKRTENFWIKERVYY